MPEPAPIEGDVENPLPAKHIRAWSTFTIKSVDADQRIIEGIASTPNTDRMGDIVESDGAQFSLPMPFLWQHNANQPIGHVIDAKVTKDGITFRAKIEQTLEPGNLKNRLDEAWQSIKLGLVRGISIGFNALKFDFMKDGGILFKEWEWLELSAVTIPANVDASIHQIRALDLNNPASDASTPAATGHPNTPAGVTATKQSKPVRSTPVAKQTIAEQISAFELQRGTKASRLEELMTMATDDSRTLEDAEKEEYDTLEREVESIDGHLVRMRKLERMNVAAARPVPTVDDSGSVTLSTVRSNPTISVKPNRPPEMGLVRIAMAKAGGLKNHMSAKEFAKQIPQWDSDTELHAALELPFRKSTVTPLNTTSDAAAADLIPPAAQLGAEFVNFLRPMTVIGRLPGIRRVPFNVQIPVQTGGTTVGWVGEAKPKPLTGVTTDHITLRWAKCAGIVTFTDELMRFSNPAIETLVRDDMAAQIVQFLDEQFLNPSVTEVANVSPASITAGAPHDSAAGTSSANLRTDIKDALLSFDSANIPLEGIYVLMRPAQAATIANIVSTLDTPVFPGISMAGGTLDGMPVLVSNSVPSGDVIFVKPSEILMADDGGIQVDVSTEATLVMSDSPTTTDSATHSLWQRNEVGIRVERYITWARRRDDAVYYYTSANYGG